MIAFSYQALGLGHAAHAGERPTQPHQSLDVLGLLLRPALVVRDQAGLIVVAEEHLLDLPADFLVQPAIGPELRQHPLEVAQCFLGAAQPHFQLGGLHRKLHPAEWVGDLPGQRLEAGQGLGRLVLLGQSGGDLLLDARVVGEEGLEASPDGQGLVVLLGALVDPAQCLEDLHEIIPRGLALQGAFKGGGGLLGLADQDQGLAEVVGGQGILGPMGLGLPERGDGGGVLPALEFEEPENQPGGAVVRGLGSTVAIGLDEGIERAAFDVVSVNAIQRRAAPGVLLERARGIVAWRGARGLLRRRPDSRPRSGS